MNCDGCSATMINGVFCYEHGCPNRNKVWDEEEEKFVSPEYDEDELGLDAEED